jgi:hypothetical protein
MIGAAASVKLCAIVTVEEVGVGKVDRSLLCDQAAKRNCGVIRVKSRQAAALCKRQANW